MLKLEPLWFVTRHVTKALCQFGIERSNDDSVTEAGSLLYTGSHVIPPLFITESERAAAGLPLRESQKITPLSLSLKTIGLGRNDGGDG